MHTPALEEGRSVKAYGPITSWLGHHHNRSTDDNEAEDDYFRPITKKEEKDIEMAVLLRRRTTGTVTRAQLALSAIRSRDPIGSLASSMLNLPPTGPEVIVNFEGEKDPYKPLNWSFKKKVITTVLYGLTTLGASFASAVYAPAVGQVSKEFEVDVEIARLGTSLLMFGFGIGPLLWAPLSELWGRKQVVLAPYLVATIFAFSTAAAKDIETILITRFFTGFFASAPICVTGGVLKDIWSSRQRGLALVGYGLSVLTGPLLAPLIGGAIVQSRLGWRWTQYVSLYTLVPTRFTNLSTDNRPLDVSHDLFRPLVLRRVFCTRSTRSKSTSSTFRHWKLFSSRQT